MPPEKTAEKAWKIVVFTRPRCPTCGSRELKSYRGAGTGPCPTRYTACKICGERFKLIVR